jgi:hypothetical protein
VTLREFVINAKKVFLRLPKTNAHVNYEANEVPAITSLQA